MATKTARKSTAAADKAASGHNHRKPCRRCKALETAASVRRCIETLEESAGDELDIIEFWPPDADEILEGKNIKMYVTSDFGDIDIARKGYYIQIVERIAELEAKLAKARKFLEKRIGTPETPAQRKKRITRLNKQFVRDFEKRVARERKDLLKRNEKSLKG